MYFEHLIQINDSQLPQLEPLSRDQLWMGLVAKAYKPEKFNTSLESTSILSEEQTHGVTKLKRELDFGNFQLRDEIELYEQSHTINSIDATDLFGKSTLWICIEEPEPGQLWLRFKYQTDDTGQAQRLNYKQADMDEARKQAYLAADIDTVKVIRALASFNPDLHTQLPSSGHAQDPAYDPQKPPTRH